MEKTRILLASSDKLFFRLVQSHLCSDTYALHCVPDCYEALNRILLGHGTRFQPGVLVLDDSCRESSITLLKTLHQRHIRLPVLVATSKEEQSVASLFSSFSNVTLARKSNPGSLGRHIALLTQARSTASGSSEQDTTCHSSPS